MNRTFSIIKPDAVKRNLIGHINQIIENSGLKIVSSKKMYLTHAPCPVCAKCIVNAGIEQVLYVKDYEPDMTGIKILRDCDVSVIKLVDN